MSAQRTRQEVRERLTKVFEQLRDRLIPLDESKPLKGALFRDWEEQADELDRAVTTVFLEDRAGLEDNATACRGGRCPFCNSDRVYLEKRTARGERQTPHGPVVLDEQRCRCRSCDRTSPPPSGAGLGVAAGHEPVAQGGGAGGAGGGGAAVRHRGPGPQ
jgi:hypothetical protein